MREHMNFIDGEEVGGEMSPNINPSDTTDIIGYYSHASAADAKRAVDAAESAQANWSATAPQVRAGVLARAGEAIAQQADAFANMIAREEGKTLREAHGEVRRAADSFKFFSAQLLRPLGEVYPGLHQGLRIHTETRPIGVVGVIAPWNYPLAIPAWKIAPALAFGNTVVFKPADLVPGAAWMLTEVLRDVGIPDGVFNLLMGRGSVVGEELVKSEKVDALTFTGSTAVGLDIARRAANDLKKTQLEMGGKNPLVVLDDADLELAKDIAIEAAYGSAGQRCTAASRILVHRRIHDQFVDAVTDAVGEIVVGDARDSVTTMGPVVDARQRDAVLRYVEDAKAEGGELLAGGDSLERNTPGFYVQPTLFAGSNSLRLNREEVFGPVACIIPIGDLDEAIHIANDTEFGLTAGLVSSSVGAASKFVQEVEAGMISINRSPAPTELHVPFGGLKKSSYGDREQGEAARSFFTNQITVYTATES